MRIYLWYILLTLCIAIYFKKEKYIYLCKKNFIKKCLNRYTSCIKEKRLNLIINLIDKITTWIMFILVVFLIQFNYIGNFKVPTGSMEPTVKIGERFFANMIGPRLGTIKRNSIIIFKEPVKNKLRYTKRLIGLPGETIEIKKDGNILIEKEKMKNKIKYYQMGIMKDKKWKVPKKGDMISTKNMILEIKSDEFDFEKLKDRIEKNELDWQSLDIRELNYKIDGKKHRNKLYELFSYITDINERKDLLSGKTVKKQGKEVKVESGVFLTLRNNITVLEAREMLKIDSKIKFGISQGEFYLNSKELTGPVYDEKIMKDLIMKGSSKLEEDYYFVLGDNSKNSYDSRYWGFIGKSRIKGELLLRYWPLNELKLMN